ncbi:hypothetical protein H4R35_000509 [Dimargaris xerosporica]|nr:hypothetical protein H4R35_001289 [Dimargaris xerosporica]KAJ1981972.1 hypothetical protein H4R35_000509 [Dimargaris xerosporica]
MGVSAKGGKGGGGGKSSKSSKKPKRPKGNSTSETSGTNSAVFDPSGNGLAGPMIAATVASVALINLAGY